MQKLNALAPWQGMVSGARCYVAGVHWLRQHPRYLFALSLPLVVGIGCLSLGWMAFFRYHDQLTAMLLFTPGEGWFSSVAFWAAKGLLYGALMILSMVLAMLVAIIVASPVYEVISAAVERDVLGRPAAEVSIWRSLLLIKEEIKKALFIVLVSVVLLFIPGANLLSVFVSAVLLAWDFYDYPLARRGWSFSQRMTAVRQDGWRLLGFGFWLVIPFVQLITIPLAVAGGTILCLQKLENRGGA